MTLELRWGSGSLWLDDPAFRYEHWLHTSWLPTTVLDRQWVDRCWTYLYCLTNALHLVIVCWWRKHIDKNTWCSIKSCALIESGLRGSRKLTSSLKPCKLSCQCSIYITCINKVELNCTEPANLLLCLVYSSPSDQSCRAHDSKLLISLITRSIRELKKSFTASTWSKSVQHLEVRQLKHWHAISNSCQAYQISISHQKRKEYLATISKKLIQMVLAQYPVMLQSSSSKEPDLRQMYLVRYGKSQIQRIEGSSLQLDLGLFYDWLDMLKLVEHHQFK